MLCKHSIHRARSWLPSHIRVHPSLVGRFNLVRPHRFGHTKPDPTTFTHVDEHGSIKLIRNVGLIAHIDAGKTTTTERMLYLARRTHHLGEVDRGDTVTDYLAEERDRGISIVSAVACLSWAQHTLHLIDTPGHVDFTMEVERSLSVVDGAVTILDGTKGVEAQTRTVWHQADRYNLPRIIYVNKMDRETASLSHAVATLPKQLTTNTRYIPIHWPVFTKCLHTAAGKLNSSQQNGSGIGRFVGIVDLTTMKIQLWPSSRSPDNSPQTSDLLHLSPNQPPILTPTSFQSVLDARNHLFGQLAELDEEFSDQYLALDNPEVLLPQDLVKTSLKRAVHSSKLIPILIGSSRNLIGVDNLLDAIIDYLPDPSYRPPPASVRHLLKSVTQHNLSRSSNLRMQVFKIFFDPHRGPLSVVRIYSDMIHRGNLVKNLNSNSQLVEKVTNIFQLTGEHHDPIECAGAGSIVALAGLESTHSGDVLGSPSTESHCESVSRLNEEQFYDPVVYAAIEPASLSTVKNLEHALICMQREDPSFTAKLNPETGQWVVGGMGDLHLEIMQSRLKREYKVDVHMGPPLIAYKELPTNVTEAVHGFGCSTGTVDGKPRKVVVLVTIEPAHLFKSQVHFDRHWLGNIDSTTQKGLLSRLQASLSDMCLCTLDMGGPLLRLPVVHTSVRIDRLLIGSSSTVLPTCLDDVRVSSYPPTHLSDFHSNNAAALALCRSATASAVTDALGKFSDWRLMEPMMSVELSLPIDAGDTLSRFIGDLSARRAEILSVQSASTDNSTSSGSSQHTTIQALAPLAELVGYSATVRSLSSGRASLHLSLADYQPVGSEHQDHIINQHRW